MFRSKLFFKCSIFLLLIICIGCNNKKQTDQMTFDDSVKAIEKKIFNQFQKNPTRPSVRGVSANVFNFAASILKFATFIQHSTTKEEV